MALLAGSSAFAVTAQPSSFKKTHAIAAPKAYDDYDDYDSDEPVFDQPEGEYTMMTRDSQSWITESFNASHSQILGSTVEMVVADDGTVWLNHMIAEYPVGTWIPATRNGNTLTIDGPQLLYMEWSDEIDDVISLYVLPMKKVIDHETQTGSYVATDDLIYTFNIAEDGTLTSTDPELLLALAVKNPDNQEQWVWKGFGDYDITISPQTDKPLELPVGLTTETWVWSDPYDKGFVNVAFDGNDIYVSGMDREVPEAWVKGTIADGKAVFQSGQYMGVDVDFFYHNYFCGAKIEQIWDPDEEAYVYVGTMTDQATFIYDAENKSLTLEGGYMTNSTADRQFPMMPYTEVVVEYQQRNPDAAPAAPYDLLYNFNSDSGEGWVWFQIPDTDVEGNLLDVSKLYYEILFDDEAQEFTLSDEDSEEYQSTMIPYSYQDWFDIFIEGTDHTVYIYTEPQKSVKICSVYINENNQQLKSEACVYELSSTIDASLDRNVVNSELFDLQGRRINHPSKGIAIRVTTYSDGTVTRTKVTL